MQELFYKSMASMDIKKNIYNDLTQNSRRDSYRNMANKDISTKILFIAPKKTIKNNRTCLLDILVCYKSIKNLYNIEMQSGTK